MVSIFYSRCERVVERPDMVDSAMVINRYPNFAAGLRPGYFIASGEPVTVFDEAVEHFAASGIELAQSDDKSKTAILIKHYFRQQKFKVILIDNSKGPVFEKSFAIKAEKDLINFKHIVVGNDGQMLVEAKTQEDPCSWTPKAKNY